MWHLRRAYPQGHHPRRTPNSSVIESGTGHQRLRRAIARAQHTPNTSCVRRRGNRLNRRCCDFGSMPVVQVHESACGTTWKASGSEQLGQLSWDEADTPAARLASPAVDTDGDQNRLALDYAVDANLLVAGIQNKIHWLVQSPTRKPREFSIA